MVDKNVMFDVPVCVLLIPILSEFNLHIRIAYVCTLYSGCNEADDCNNHGSCDKEQNLCHCDHGYTGELCESGGKIFGSVILETHSHYGSVLSLSFIEICAGVR